MGKRQNDHLAQSEKMLKINKVVLQKWNTALATFDTYHAGQAWSLSVINKIQFDTGKF